MMREVQDEMFGKWPLIGVDDVIIWARDAETLKDRIEAILERLMERGLLKVIFLSTRNQVVWADLFR